MTVSVLVSGSLCNILSLFIDTLSSVVPRVARTRYNIYTLAVFFRRHLCQAIAQVDVTSKIKMSVFELVHLMNAVGVDT